MKRWIPNSLTVLRFLLVPVFLYYVFVSVDPQRVSVALLVFVIASFTDYLDGMLARRLNVVSDFGKIMDPLADKLLVLSALAGLCWLPPFYISKLVFFIILFRELLITILRELYHRKGIVVAADVFGKVKTVMQMTGIIAAFALWVFMAEIPSYIHLAVDIWFAIVAVVTLASGINYIKVIFKRN
ncbi:MAG: CDP-diacylglycerol--glycerol-3-phosphate 3-phosphatidyltransferase [Candidatus Cloacimonetes bacterium]|nr:CDP-diacylglycerol--glycerol-3-phosphate 3-phosphatidyltransferase [Candidatus Cloacimonadota bacterium]